MIISTDAKSFRQNLASIYKKKKNKTLHPESGQRGDIPQHNKGQV